MSCRHPLSTRFRATACPLASAGLAIRDLDLPRLPDDPCAFGIANQVTTTW